MPCYKLQMFGSQLDNGHRLDQHPSTKQLLLHTQGGVKVSGTENKVKFSTEEPLHRTQLLCRFETIFPCGTCQQSSLKDHFLPIAFSKVCYMWSACSYIRCPSVVSGSAFSKSCSLSLRASQQVLTFSRLCHLRLFAHNDPGGWELENYVHVSALH